MTTSVIVMEPEPFHVFLLVFGVFTILFSTFGRFLKERLSLTEPLLATFLGIFCTGVGILPSLDPSRNESMRGVLLELTRLTIVIQVVTTALELPVGLLHRQAWPLFLLLVPLLSLSWGAGSLFTWAVGGMAPLEAALAGACITSTDPVLVHAVVKGSFAEAILPSRLRDLLSAESSANDGFALPFVMLPTLLMRGVRGGRFAAEYLVHVWLYQVVVGVVLGAAIGHVAGVVLRWAAHRRLIESESLFAFSIVLALAVEGCHRLLGLSEFVGAFAAGITFTGAVNAPQRLAELQIQETTDLLVGNLFFLVFGASLPWDLWFAQGPAGGFAPWRLVLLSVLLLCLKRLPFLLALYRLMPAGIKSLAEAAHIGWFGSVGVAAYYYALTTLEDRELPPASRLRVYLVVTWLITVSVGLHGLTGVPVTLLLRRGMVRDDQDEEEVDQEEDGRWGPEEKEGEDGEEGMDPVGEREQEVGRQVEEGDQRRRQQQQQQQQQQGDQDAERDQAGPKGYGKGLAKGGGAVWRELTRALLGRGSGPGGAGSGVGGRDQDVEGAQQRRDAEQLNGGWGAGARGGSTRHGHRDVGAEGQEASVEGWDGRGGGGEGRGMGHARADTVLEVGQAALQVGARAAGEVRAAVGEVGMRVGRALEEPWRPRRQRLLMRAALRREGVRRRGRQQQQQQVAAGAAAHASVPVVSTDGQGPDV